MNNCCVKTLKLENYRNIISADLEFCDGINVITGENGQGKTNLIEALWLLTGAKSFRGSKDRDLINRDCNFGRIVSVLEDEDNYEMFEPYLAKIVETHLRFAAYMDPDKHPYDVWLDKYEPGLNMEKCEEFFSGGAQPRGKRCMDKFRFCHDGHLAYVCRLILP